MQKLEEIEFDPKIRLGEGSYGTVFPGMYKGQKVAVKMVRLIDTDENEEHNLKRLNHPNIVRLFHVENDIKDKYFALELCDASLDQLFLDEKHTKKYRGPKLPWSFTVFLQLACGLEHIHSQNLIHRDIKPENVFISIGFFDQKITIKWADFGLSKPVNERGTYTMTRVRGTMNWMAPELLKQLHEEDTGIAPVVKRRGTVKSDVFAQGLVFGYFISDGKHLFGSSRKIELNIVENNPVNLASVKSSRARELLLKMLKGDPGERATSQEVVKQLKSTIKELDDTFPANRRKNRRMLETRLFELLEESYIDLQEIKILIDKGVDVNCVNEKGLTPFLHLMRGCSTKTNLTETMQLLIDNNVDVNRKYDRWNALHYLCSHYGREDLIDIIQLLIQHGIAIDSNDKGGQNALHLLCEYYKKDNLTDIVNLLIKNGINVNSYNKKKWNALHISCQHYQREKLIDIVRLFIEKEIDVNFKNNYEENALQMLCRNKKYKKWMIEIIRLLIEKGIDVNNKGKKGWTALHSLCTTKENEVDIIDEIQLLIEHGIDVNLTTKDGWNALQILCHNYKNENLIEIVRLLIQNGIDVNWKTKSKWNALQFLCKFYSNNNLIDIVRLLIEHEIHVNHKAYEGNALHLLCKYYPNENLVDILQLLISNGITVTLNDVDPRILIRQNPNQADNDSVIQLLHQQFYCPDGMETHFGI